MLNLRTTALILSFASLLAAGCGRREPASSAGVRVGLALPDAADPFFLQVKEGAQEMARDRQAQLLLHDAGGSAEEQSKGIEGLIEQGTPVVMAAPVDPARLREAASRAATAKSYLVMLEQAPEGADVSSVITFNYDLAGRLAAEFFDQKLAGSGRVAVLSDDRQPAPDMVGAFKAGITRGKIEYLGVERMRDEADGAAAAERMVKRAPSAILATSESAARALMARAQGGQQIVIAALGGSPELLKELDGETGLALVLARPARQMGSAACRIALRIAGNDAAPQQLALPIFPVTRENRGDYPGWDSPMPKEFTAPWPSKLQIRSERE